MLASTCLYSLYAWFGTVKTGWGKGGHRPQSPCPSIVANLTEILGDTGADQKD